jgi:hypothetical protein
MVRRVYLADDAHRSPVFGCVGARLGFVERGQARRDLLLIEVWRASDLVTVGGPLRRWFESTDAA